MSRKWYEERHTVTEEEEITASNSADGPVEGLAPEAEILLRHDDGGIQSLEGEGEEAMEA